MGEYGRETLTREFKSDRKPLPDNQLIEAIVALSNTEGGALYLGVEDDSTPTGVSEGHADSVGLVAMVDNRTRPSVRVNATLTGNPQIMRIEVPKASTIIATHTGRALRRRLKEDGTPEVVPLYPYEFSTRLSDLGRLDFSAQPIPGSSRGDFDPLERERLRALIGDSPSADQSLLELDDERLEKALELTVQVEGESIPTLTGLLMLGREESLRRLVPTHEASFQAMEGTSVKVNRDYHGPLLKIVEQISDLFNAWNPGTELAVGLFSRVVPAFDERAFREAIVNAFGHRDYSVIGRVLVRLDTEGLTVSSRGGFVEGINVHNLMTADPHGRNRTLMDVLKRCGLAERTGRGIDRIFEGSLNYGRPLPDYSSSNSQHVKVFIPRSAPDPMFVEMLDEERERTGKELSINGLLVLNMLKTEGECTFANMLDSLDINRSRLQTVLNQLQDGGLVESSGRGDTKAFMLGAKAYKREGKEIEYVRRSGIDRIRYPELIMKLAQSQGTVSTADIEQLLQISSARAYYQLKKLVEQERLERIGKGRNTRYSTKA